jgi:peptidoglycan-associated lipoprotein
MNKGVRSLFGKHIDEEEYAYLQQRQKNTPFMQLHEDDRYEAAIGFEEVESSSEPIKQVASKFSSASIEQFSSPEGGLKNIFSNIHFETDNYSIKGNENFDFLQKIATYLCKHPDTLVYIEGHADERGAAAYNLALGARRANAVRTFLIENGVHTEQLLTISYGKERPLVMSHDPLAWEKNRRAQFKLYATEK